MSAITRKRTTHGHMQTWFVARKPDATERVPLTPVQGEHGGRRTDSTRAQKWQAAPGRFNKPQRGHRYPLWRARRRGNRFRQPPMVSRPARPAGLSFSVRAPSLRQGPFFPFEHSLQDLGTHFDARQPLYFSDENNDPVCLRTHIPWLDEYGSNEALFGG